MKTYTALLMAMISLTGCIRMTCMSPSCLGEETYNNLMHPKPYGAHWVKDGMTRESRLSDFVQCGGGADLRENYAEWLSTIPYETYSAGKTQHIRTISDCMKSKNYAWQDSCDTRCLYP